MKIEIKGLEELQRKILELANEQILSQGIQDATKRVEATAKQLVPIDTGELKESIYSTYDATNNIGTVGATAPHAAHVEFGTRKTPAQPYLYPALELNREYLTEELTKSINKHIKELSNK